MALLGDRAEAQAAALGDAEPPDPFARQDHGPGLRGEHFSAQSGEELVLPVARHARDAEHLARPHAERDVPQRDPEFGGLRQAEVLDFQLRQAEHALRRLGNLLEIRADHHFRHRARRLVLGIGGSDHLAAAQDRGRIAKRDDLVQLVGNVEDRAAACGEAAQHLEQLLDLLRRQHRGRLVHDQETRIEQQRAHDLDSLPLADAERRDDPARIELEVIEVEHLVELGEQLALGMPRVKTERDVLQHRQRLKQREMLENHADAEAARGAGIGDSDRRAIEQNLAFVRRLDPVNHLDEGRLASPVLAEQRMNLARLDLEMDVVVGAHAGERLADADQLQSQGSFNLHLAIPLTASPNSRPFARGS